MRAHSALRTAALVGGLSVLLLGVRAWLALTPLLAETYYDEAITGLMGLAILRGEPQVFFWGQPYLGAVDAYLAALGFGLVAPTTLVLRLTTGLTTVLWCWAALDLARRTAGPKAGLLAGLYLALPPIFLIYAQLSSHGESVAMSFGTVALALAAALSDQAAPSGRRGLAWLALGGSAGLAWWGSQMTAMLLLAAAMALLCARPRALREPGPYGALGAFLLTSLPFWAWNARHEWSTFHHLLAWGGALPSWGERVVNVWRAFVASTRGVFWDARAVTLPPALDALGLALIAAFYGPALVLAGSRLLIWAGRLARRARPWQEPLDAVALAFWLTVAAHLLTWFGTSGVIRYSMTFYATVPVLGAVALARLGALGRAGRAAAVTVGLGLVLYHGAQVAGFVRQASAGPVRPVDAALARLATLHLSACYADSRISQVLTFESAGRVACADFLGLRDYALLQHVDAVPAPSSVALVAHRVLRHPEPDVLGATLAAAGIESRRDEVGDYVIFHGFRPPPEPLRPVEPGGWSARASLAGASAGLAFDRRVWTRWVGAQVPGTWFELDLGRVLPVAQVTLEGGNPVGDAPLGLVVETSVDGRSWDGAVRLPQVQPGLHWWQGRPRIDESARIIVRMTPRPTRYVRVTHAGGELPGRGWGLAEIFVYEATASSWAPPLEAVQAIEHATGLVGRWMDDPTGPHPRRAPVTYEHRRAQVDWGGASRAVNRALDLAPGWEEAHHLYARIIDLARWTEDPDLVVDRAWRDRAWPEVVRWVAQAETAHPGFWRAGRDRAAAEALAALGHPADAAGLARRGAPAPARPVTAEFGPGLTFLGFELPPAVRRGGRLSLAGHWELHGPPAGDLAAFVHLVGPAGHRLNLDHVLGEHYYPTSRWSSGERVRQAVTVTIPADAPPGVYAVRVGVWLPQTGKQLRVARTDGIAHGRAVEVGQVVVAP